MGFSALMRAAPEVPEASAAAEANACSQMS